MGLIITRPLVQGIQDAEVGRLFDSDGRVKMSVIHGRLEGWQSHCLFQYGEGIWVRTWNPQLAERIAKEYEDRLDLPIIG